MTAAKAPTRSQHAADSDTTVYAKVVGYTATPPRLRPGCLDGDRTSRTPTSRMTPASRRDPIAVDAAAQQHTIHLDDDEDWVSFTVTAGRAYTIQTAEGTPADASHGPISTIRSDDPDRLQLRRPVLVLPVLLADRHVADADRRSTRWSGARLRPYGAIRIQRGAGRRLVRTRRLLRSATPLTVGAAAQQHSIDPDDDEDWVSFTVDHRLQIHAHDGAECVARRSEHGTLPVRLGRDDADHLQQRRRDRGQWDFSRIDYTADADKTVFAKVAGWDTGTYALSVTLVGDSVRARRLLGRREPARDG